MNAGGEVERVRLGEYVALHKHGMCQSALTEDPVEQRQHPRVDTQTVQRLIRPQVPKHGHIGWLRVFAGSGGIGDTGGHGGVLGQPPAFHGLVQKSGTHIENRVAWQQASQKQIAVLSQARPQGFPIVQVFGRIPEGFVLKHGFPLDRTLFRPIVCQPSPVSRIGPLTVVCPRHGVRVLGV